VLLPCTIRTACHAHTHAHTPAQATHTRATSRRVGRCWSARTGGRPGSQAFLLVASSPGSCLCCSCPFFLQPRRPGTLNAAPTLPLSTHRRGTGRGLRTLAAFWSGVPCVRSKQVSPIPSTHHKAISCVFESYMHTHSYPSPPTHPPHISQ